MDAEAVCDEKTSDEVILHAIMIVPFTNFAQIVSKWA